MSNNNNHYSVTLPGWECLYGKLFFKNCCVFLTFFAENDSKAPTKSVSIKQSSVMISREALLVNCNKACDI